MNKSLLLATLAVMLVATSEAFTSAFVGQQHRLVARRTTSPLQMAVVDIDSESAFDDKIKSAGKSLVIIDYSTTWCGPCKVIAPKFEEFSAKYPDAVFLKVIGDASPEASKLMKREGVRSVPSFHYFMSGEKIDVVNGANAEAIEAAIAKHVSATA